MGIILLLHCEVGKRGHAKKSALTAVQAAFASSDMGASANLVIRKVATEAIVARREVRLTYFVRIISIVALTDASIPSFSGQSLTRISFIPAISRSRDAIALSYAGKLSSSLTKRLAAGTAKFASNASADVTSLGSTFDGTAMSIVLTMLAALDNAYLQDIDFNRTAPTYRHPTMLFEMGCNPSKILLTYKNSLFLCD